MTSLSVLFTAIKLLYSALNLSCGVSSALGRDILVLRFIPVQVIQQPNGQGADCIFNLPTSHGGRWWWQIGGNGGKFLCIGENFFSLEAGPPKSAR